MTIHKARDYPVIPEFEVFRQLDPAPLLDVNTEQFRIIGEAKMNQIMQTSRYPEPQIKDRRVSVKAIRWAAIPVAAAAAFGLSVVLPGAPGVAPAFASWTPVPQEVSADELAARTADCEHIAVTNWKEWEATDGARGGVELPLVLAEVRGDYTVTIRSDGEKILWCFQVLDGAGIQGPEDATVPLNTSPTGVLTEYNEPDTFGGTASLAFGVVAPDIVAIETTTSDGRLVNASIQNGWWAMWAPETLPEVATVTRADGTRDEVSIRAVRDRCEQTSDGDIINCDPILPTNWWGPEPSGREPRIVVTEQPNGEIIFTEFPGDPGSEGRQDEPPVEVVVTDHVAE